MTPSLTLTVGLLLVLLAGGALQAQAAPTAADTTDTEAPKRHLAVALGYGSNSTYFGRSQAMAFPYFSTDPTYTTKNGLYGSVEVYNYLNTPNALDETDLSLGWDHDFGRTLDVSVSYSRFFFPKGSELVKSNVNNALDAALGQDWGLLYSRLDATFLFGKSTSKGDAFLTLENSRSFKVPHVFGASHYITIEPLVSIAAGTQSFVEASLTKRHGPKIRSARTFEMVDYEFSIPVSYTVGKLELAAGWRYVVPVNLPADDLDSRALSVWTAGLTLTL